MRQVLVRPEWGLPEAEDERTRQPGWHEYRWGTPTLTMNPIHGPKQAEHPNPVCPPARRLAFTREVRGRQAFERQLQEMRQELEVALSKG